MEIDTKKAIEVGSELVESIATVKKFVSIIPFGKPRKIKQRGTWERRGATKERRVLGLGPRLRTGFWLEFHRLTGLGKFEVLDLNHTMRDFVYQAAVKHSQKYEFSDRTSGVVLEPSTIVDSAIEIAWKDWASQPRAKRQAVLVIESIADHLASKYNVKALDRRQNRRRMS